MVVRAKERRGSKDRRRGTRVRHRTVAEGVEDTDTLRMLGDFGVDHMQGFLIGRPEPVVPA